MPCDRAVKPTPLTGHDSAIINVSISRLQRAKSLWWESIILCKNNLAVLSTLHLATVSELDCSINTLGPLIL